MRETDNEARQDAARKRRRTNLVLAVVGLVVIVVVIFVVTGNQPATSPSSDQNTPVAIVPTNTSQPQSPTPTSMPPAVTPTDSAVDSAVGTPIPTPRPGPYGYLDLVRLAEDDLDSFEVGDLAETGVDPTQFSLLGIQVVRTDIFYNYTQGETLILVLAGVPGGLGQLAVDLALDNADQAVSLASGFVDFEVQQMEVKSVYQDIGDNSNGGSAIMETEGVIYPMELGAFRNGNGMAAVIVVFPEDAQPSVDVLDLMHTLNQRVTEARTEVQ